MNRLLAGGALAVFIAAMVAIAIGSATSGDGGHRTTTVAQTSIATGSSTATAPTPRKATPVKLTGAGAYDPQGDHHENNDLAPLAVDRNPATFWKTEHYNSFSKSGVGLLLDAGRRRTISRVFVSTDSAGSSAQIELGDNAAGPFHAVSPNRPLSGTTAFTLTRGAAGRYVVIWITSLPQTGEAHITEVRAESG